MSTLIRATRRGALAALVAIAFAPFAAHAAGVTLLNVSYDVPTQAADMAAMIKWLLSSGAKPGSVKGSAYTTLIPITKENAESSTACWNLADLKK